MNDDDDDDDDGNDDDDDDGNDDDGDDDCNENEIMHVSHLLWWCSRKLLFSLVKI